MPAHNAERLERRGAWVQARTMPSYRFINQTPAIIWAALAAAVEDSGLALCIHASRTVIHSQPAPLYQFYLFNGHFSSYSSAGTAMLSYPLALSFILNNSVPILSAA